MPKQYVNLTPRWSELLRSWQMIVADAVKVKKPDQMERFWSQVETAFKAADRYNDLVSFLRGEGYDDAEVRRMLNIGRERSERERNTVHEEPDQ